MSQDKHMHVCESGAYEMACDLAYKEKRKWRIYILFQGHADVENPRWRGWRSLACFIVGGA